ncbi:hypothetical protein L2E82_14515 [Cichorium intybus]|uniref:Uncharacterized protein n=1 Tax=Cichorium intybus TaxID=13427 RepID=A0ACB9F0K7_CICIN|nr:hypothetical protein L2E82_14515 [Cichorium intybus]
MQLADYRVFSQELKFVKLIGVSEIYFHGLDSNREHQLIGDLLPCPISAIVLDFGLAFQPNLVSYAYNRDDDELNEEDSLEFDAGFGNIIVVENFPIVPREKFEKLEGVVRKIYSQIGVINENGLWKTRGYCFIEYNTPQEAELDKEKTNRYKLDRAHIFAVNMFDEFEKFMKENLQHWLTDEKGRDQFVISVGSDTEVLWNDARQVKADPVYKRPPSRYLRDSTHVTTLSNVEAKKRFEFLEAVSGTMDAHLRYFRQGYELLHQMEPYINQVLTYAQQSQERSNYERAALNERMQEYKRQIHRQSRWSSNGSNGSPNGDGIQDIGRRSHKMIEAFLQSASKGKGSGGQISGHRNTSELGHGLLSRWLSSHHHHGHGGVHDEKSVAHHTVNLLTSTIKFDADLSNLSVCLSGSPMGSSHHRSASDSSSFEISDFDHTGVEEYVSASTYLNPGRLSRISQHHHHHLQSGLKLEKPIDVLRRFAFEKKKNKVKGQRLVFNSMDITEVSIIYRLGIVLLAI